MTVKELLQPLYDERPYKVVGKPETYSSYNEGWQDALDAAARKFEAFIKPKPKKIFFRLLTLPFVFGIAFLKSMTRLFQWLYNFVIHGGELIPYKMNDRASIQDIYEELKKEFVFKKENSENNNS